MTDDAHDLSITAIRHGDGKLSATSRTYGVCIDEGLARLDIPITTTQPARRRSSGFRLRRLRDAQFLPLGWGHLTAVDVAHLQARVDETLASDAATLPEMEAALLLWASLVTGRTAAQLLPLSLCRVPRHERPDDQPAGLLKVQERWGWWLPAGAPREQRHARSGRDQFRTWSPLVYLPATKKVSLLIHRCLRLRRDAGGGALGPPQAVPLFAIGPALVGRITELLAHRASAPGGRARRATTTPESVARWLPGAITQAAGGDAVPASIICGEAERAAQTAVYYGAVNLSELATQYERAIGAVDKLSASPKFLPVLKASAGDRLTPTDESVRAASTRLGNDLTAPDLTASERHMAMTRYTAALLSFALAHRVKFGSIPAAATVDAETGFVEIADKVIQGRLHSRLVWVCDIAWKQLQLYEDHLDKMEQRAGPAAVQIAQQRRGPSLPLFRLKADKVEQLTVHAAVSEAMRFAGLPLPNAGRHWLRAALLGRCSSETLHAFYGHGFLEDGIWDWAGGLDPCAYRADLARSLDPVLAEAGWVPRSAGWASEATP